MSDQDLKVISLGGSLVAPEGIDKDFVAGFRDIIIQWLETSVNRKLIFVVGGGAPARKYQQATKSLVPDVSNTDLDWVGIAATRLNAELIRAVFAKYVFCPVAEDPETAEFNAGRILVASGWKPGFSTDYDAVVLAERFCAESLINLSNIDAVYTADPRIDPQAQPLTKMTWIQLQAMVGSEWEPGGNWPFDPVATARASLAGLHVIVTRGSDLDNLKKILDDTEYKGTTIAP